MADVGYIVDRKATQMATRNVVGDKRVMILCDVFSVCCVVVSEVSVDMILLVNDIIIRPKILLCMQPQI